MWNNPLEVDILGATREELHLKIQISTCTNFILSAIYSLSFKLVKDILWNNLATISTLLNLPWLVLGDFNQVSNSFENKEVTCQF